MIVPSAEQLAGWRADAEAARRVPPNILRQRDLAVQLLQTCAHIERLTQEHERLAGLLSTAQAYRESELACASHRTQCHSGCNDDFGAECKEYGGLWLAEMRARTAMWDAIDAALARNG